MDTNYIVIAIPDRTRIIINAGKENSNIKVGDKIEIFSPSLEVYDPTTSAFLFDYGVEKYTLKVTNVYDNYSILRKEKIIENGILPDLTKMLTPLSDNKITYSKLDVVIKKETEYDEETSIKIGDFARITYWHFENIKIR